MAEMSTDQRIDELEAELEDARAEINQLRLQLHVFTSTDAITGLANRNGLLDSLQGAIDRQQRMAEPYCVVFLRFPQLGGLMDDHHEDDYEEALRHLGAIVAAGLRTVDRVGRLDETTFVAVLTNRNAVRPEVEQAQCLDDEFGHSVDVAFTLDLYAEPVASFRFVAKQ